MKNNRTWIVAIDGGAMRVFEAPVPGATIIELEQLAMKAPPPSAPRARPPRMHDRMGPSRHAIEKRLTPHTRAENDFLEDAARRLQAWSQQDAFDQLIVCAPPHAAGVLKAHIGDALARRLRIVTKDVLHESAAQIAARFDADFS